MSKSSQLEVNNARIRSVQQIKVKNHEKYPFLLADDNIIRHLSKHLFSTNQGKKRQFLTREWYGGKHGLNMNKTSFCFYSNDNPLFDNDKALVSNVGSVYLHFHCGKSVVEVKMIAM